MEGERGEKELGVWRKKGRGSREGERKEGAVRLCMYVLITLTHLG